MRREDVEGGKDLAGVDPGRTMLHDDDNSRSWGRHPQHLQG